MTDQVTYPYKNKQNYSFVNYSTYSVGQQTQRQNILNLTTASCSGT